MKQNPRILISNDDGIKAPGLAHLITIAQTISDDVWVVAPATNQSGAGHRFTLGHELEFEEHGPRQFSLNGTPADCIVAGCTHLLKEHLPDVILSGVNHGQNTGDIINCSGTVAAAREGAMQGVLSIALSQGLDYERQKEICWDPVIIHGGGVIKNLIEIASGGDIYYNVNFPFCSLDEISGVRFVPHQRFERSAFKHYPSKNAGKFFVSIPETPKPMSPEHDFYVLHADNAITITPLSLRQSDLPEIQRLQGKIALNAS